MNALIQVTALSALEGEYRILEVGAKTAEVLASRQAYSAYLAGHIPQAQYVDLNQHFCALQTDLHYQHPNVEELTRSLQYFQLDLTQTIVMYDRQNHIWATRLWWVLYAYGFKHIYVLSGGLQAWKTQGGVLEQGEYKALTLNHDIPRNLSLNARCFASQREVEQVVSGDKQAQLLNVLRPEVYQGRELRYARRGHIPGSLNIPFAEFLNEKGEFFQSYDHFESAFGLQLDQEIIIYCGSGITASGAAFALIQSQATSVKIYDGSMAEWSANPALPLQSLN